MNAGNAIVAPAAGPDLQAPDAVDIADHLLSLLLADTATSVWFDPRGHGVTDLSVEHRHDPIGTYRVDGGVGDAVVARLALLAGLDLAGAGSQAGTASVRQGDRTTEVVVSLRGGSLGLGGELRLFADRPTPVIGARGGGQVPELFEAGTRIGGYWIERELGRGGMGVVYEVEHAVLGRRFALKVLSGDVMVRDPASARRFVREARAAARIRHPGIVEVTDFGTLPDGRPYLVMEKLDGKSLQQILLGEGALEPARAVRLLKSAAEALAVAHERGVVHRDLTPANVFVLGVDAGDDGHPTRVVLVDFGSATTPEPEHADVPDGPPGTVIGTPHYMAPEMIRGRGSDTRTDLYALGTILFELVAGAPPYDADTARGIALQHLEARIPRLFSPHQELPEELVQLSARLLAKDREARPQSAAEVAIALDRIEALLARRGWRRWLPG
ncbi:MAG TPA: serine/threonine-protein kinase [Kofleriaceae bacterium]|nr:serine/threonine-protein kinase [Kofleriaceae bacterium]